MDNHKHTYGILIVSSGEKFNNSISALLSENDYSPITFSNGVIQAKWETLKKYYDLIIINVSVAELETATKFATDIVSDSSTVIMMLVNGDSYNRLSFKMTNHGILLLKKPTSAQAIIQSLDHMRAFNERLKGLRRKTVTVEEKMEEIRLVNRAKWLLIENLQMTEPEAHRYIEKQAMDRCITRKEMAENILSAYQSIK